MEAVQAITGSGGWPMTVFLTPDRRPFFGGTYFPPDDRHGHARRSRTVLAALTDVWTNRRAEVEEQADELAEAIGLAIGDQRPPGSRSHPRRPGGRGPPTSSTAGRGRELAERFDPEWGGFGRAPKFPQPTLIDLALPSLRWADRTTGP